MATSGLIVLGFLTGQAVIESHPQLCGGPPQHWSALPIVPSNSHTQPVNVIEIEADGRLLWNGARIGEEQAREYLGILANLMPRPLLVLRVRPGADCAGVQRLRQMIDSKLKCDAESCGEFDG